MATDTQTTMQASSVPSERLLYGPPDWIVVGTGSNATITATAAAVTGKQNHIFDLTLSYSAAPGAASTLTVKDGTTVIWQAEIPAATTAPIVKNFRHAPLHSSAGNALVAGVTTPGASTTATISISGITASPQ